MSWRSSSGAGWGNRVRAACRTEDGTVRRCGDFRSWSNRVLRSQLRVSPGRRSGGARSNEARGLLPDLLPSGVRKQLAGTWWELATGWLWAGEDWQIWTHPLGCHGGSAGGGGRVGRQDSEGQGAKVPGLRCSGHADGAEGRACEGAAQLGASWVTAPGGMDCGDESDRRRRRVPLRSE